jgi:hypothetical protein
VSDSFLIGEARVVIATRRIVAAVEAAVSPPSVLGDALVELEAQANARGDRATVELLANGWVADYLANRGDSLEARLVQTAIDQARRDIRTDIGSGGAIGAIKGEKRISRTIGAVPVQIPMGLTSFSSWTRSAAFVHTDIYPE